MMLWKQSFEHWLARSCDMIDPLLKPASDCGAIGTDTSVANLYATPTQELAGEDQMSSPANVITAAGH